MSRLLDVTSLAAAPMLTLAGFQSLIKVDDEGQAAEIRFGVLLAVSQILCFRLLIKELDPRTRVGAGLMVLSTLVLFCNAVIAAFGLVVLDGSKLWPIFAVGTIIMLLPLLPLVLIAAFGLKRRPGPEVE